MDLSFFRPELAIVFEFSVFSGWVDAVLVDFVGVDVFVGDVVMMVLTTGFVLLVTDLFGVDRLSSSEEESYFTPRFFLDLNCILRDRFLRCIDSENH